MRILIGKEFFYSIMFIPKWIIGNIFFCLLWIELWSWSPSHLTTNCTTWNQDQLLFSLQTKMVPTKPLGNIIWPLLLIAFHIESSVNDLNALNTFVNSAPYTRVIVSCIASWRVAVGTIFLWMDNRDWDHPLFTMHCLLLVALGCHLHSFSKFI